MAGEELAKLLSSPSTCVVPVLELKKMRAFSFFLFLQQISEEV